MLFFLMGGLILIFIIFFLPHIKSSGDSTGSTTAQSEADYDAIIASRPSTILALIHKTIRKFLWFNALKIFSLTDMYFIMQKPPREYHLIIY